MFKYKGSTALITGASSGLGEVFARILAARGCDLILTARSEAKLKELARRLADEFGIKASVVVADLASPTGPQEVLTEIQMRNLTIDLLINNAGFGVFERFLDAPLERQLEEIQVNVQAPLILAYVLAPGMVSRKRGGIINLSSSAAFQPLAGANLYAASKSFIRYFSEALARELAGTGVNVLAVCPGPVDTGFFDAMNPVVKRKDMDRPETVVNQTLRAFDREKRVVVPGRFAVRVMATAVRFFPRTVVARIAESTTRKLNQSK